MRLLKHFVPRSLWRYSHTMASLRPPREPLVTIIGTTGTGKSDVGQVAFLFKKMKGDKKYKKTKRTSI